MPRLRDLSIKAKLSAGFGLSLVLIFAIGAISLVQLWGINALATRVTESWLPQMETLGEIKRAMGEHFFLAKRRINTTNFHQIAADFANMNEVQVEIDNGVRRFTALADRPAVSALLDRFRSESAAYRQSLDMVLSRIDAGDPVSAQEEFDTVTTAAFASATRIINDLLKVSKAEGRSAAEDVRSVYGLALALIIAMLLFAALSVSGAIRWISLNVSKPILSISGAMQRLSAGDNSVSVSERLDRRDEIGVLVNAVTGYRDSLNRVRQLANEANLERQRLDAALTNMSQGLVMFDSSANLVVCNQHYLQMYGLSPEIVRPGCALREILDHRVATGSMCANDVETYMADILGAVDQGKGFNRIANVQDGRTISVLNQPIADGGWVATHEDITERLRAEERIKHLAHYDALTDLPNRVSFYEQTQTVLGRLRRSETVAILSLDLDHFKNVNDTLGHPVGDRLLQAAAERMRSCVRAEDIVARLGGDEFAIVQVPTGQPSNIATLAARLIESVGAPYDIDSQQVVIGVSIGIAIAPTDSDVPDTLIKHADLALYRAKADGGGAFRFFEAEMDARMQARHALELDLRKAIMNGEFELFYQPIVDVKTGQITSCEALIRWHHPERGMVEPLEFIPVAEETGLIVPLGEWVLRQACAEASRWPKQITIAVNLSPAQFKSRNLVQTVVNALASSDLPAGRLELEITELVLLQENEGAFAILHQLRELGIRIAMDDFGTGYSSLGYLRSFPFDKIKIDQSFIHDLSTKEDSVAIIRAVVGLSSSLGITTTAEGVETKEQFERLTSEGCNEVQGFLFSQPRPAADIERILDEQGPRIEAVA